MKTAKAMQTIPDYHHIFDDPNSWSDGPKKKTRLFGTLIRMNAGGLLLSVQLMEKKGRFYELKSLNDFNQKVAEEALM